MLKNAQQFSHQLLQDCLRKGDMAIDATAGNGFDTLLLAQLVGETGKVLAFDIQEQALQNTLQKLEDHHLAPIVQLIHDSHANMANYLTTSVQAAIFNLGYLPGSDKTIITEAESTRQALLALMQQLNVGGRIIIVCYWGHSGGEYELQMLQNFLPTLPQKNWTVLQYQFMNQQNYPPICFVIERKNSINK